MLYFSCKRTAAKRQTLDIFDVKGAQSHGRMLAEKLEFLFIHRFRVKSE
jgi:hypothetical protein